MAISRFKATCLAVLERVRRTGQPLRITRFGKPIADIVPPAPDEPAAGWLGAMADSGVILGDLVAPTGAESDWEVLRSRRPAAARGKRR